MKNDETDEGELFKEANVRAYFSQYLECIDKEMEKLNGTKHDC